MKRPPSPVENGGQVTTGMQTETLDGASISAGITPGGQRTVRGPKLEDQMITELDYVTYYCCMWNTLTVIAPELGVTLKYDNSELCRSIAPADHDRFFCAEIERRIGSPDQPTGER